MLQPRHDDTARRTESDPLRGPVADELGAAIEQAATHNLPGVLGVEAVRTLTAATDLPLSVGRRTIREANVTEGNPRNGAMRTDAHVSHYEVIAPLSAFDLSDLSVDGVEKTNEHGCHDPHCAGCGSREVLLRIDNTQWDYEISVFCVRCDDLLAKNPN